MSDKTKNLLIVSYYFPPMGLGGVQRAAKTAKYMAALGWSVSVIAGGENNYPLRDNSILEDLPSSVKISFVDDPLAGVPGSSSKDKYIIRGKPGFLQRMIRLPDSKIFWTQKANVLAEKIAAEENIGYLITSAPPPSLNKIGLRLKKKFKLRWIADFRDPWFADEFPPITPVHKMIREKLESALTEEADYIACVTENHADNLRRKFTTAAEKIVHIPNGFDPDDIKHLKQKTPDKLVFAHCGTLCDSHGVEAFFEILSRLMERDNSLRGLTEFHQIGAVFDDLIQMLKTRYRQKIDMRFYGYLDHAEALGKLAESSVILVFGGMHRHSPLIIPGKLYEGLALSRPLAAVVEKDSAVTGVIGNLPGCYHLDPDNREALSSRLENLINDFREGKLYNQPRGNLIEKYSREFQAKQFAELLEK